MDLGGLGWILLDIVGPGLLIAVLAWAILRNRRSNIPPERTERGTRQVYDEAEEVRREGDDGA
jgi:hypothetical protein